MKKYLSTILCVLVFIVGLSIMLYPTVSDYINRKNASRVIAEYEAVLANATPEDLTAWFAAADAYNEALAAMPAAFYIPDLISGYEDALNIAGNGVMGYVDIDKLNIHLPIYHGVEAVVLQVGVGHLPGTSLPVGGRSTHAVISGHTGLPSSKLFTDIDDLEIGDIFTITVLNQIMTYQVDQIKVVLPEETQDLMIVEGMDYFTLLTCTPYGINSHRLLVRGVRVDSIYGEDGGRSTIYVVNEAFKVDAVIVATIVTVPMLIILLAVFYIADRRKKQKELKSVMKGEIS